MADDDDHKPGCTSTRNTGGDLPIPVKLLPNRAPVLRSCTKHWKIVPIRQWLKAHGATPDDPAAILIGISTDEWQRATSKPRDPMEVAEYPLLDLGLSRDDCMDIITDAGLPVPPKSTCWFCPFHNEAAWTRRRDNEPALFNRAVDLEEYLNAQRRWRNLNPVQFLRKGPLKDLRIADTEPSTFNEGSCDEGYCWT
jgi:hypothetical protein